MSNQESLMSFLLDVSQRGGYIIGEGALRMLNRTLTCTPRLCITVLFVESPDLNLDFIVQVARSRFINLCCVECNNEKGECTCYETKITGENKTCVTVLIKVVIVGAFVQESSLLNYSVYNHNGEFFSEFLLDDGVKQVPFATIEGLIFENTSAYYEKTLDQADIARVPYRCPNPKVREIITFDDLTFGSTIGKYDGLFRDEKLKILAINLARSCYGVKGPVVNSIVYGSSIVQQEKIVTSLIQIFYPRCVKGGPLQCFEEVLREEGLYAEYIENESVCNLEDPIWTYNILSYEKTKSFGDLHIQLQLTCDLYKIPVICINDSPTLVPSTDILGYRVVLNYPYGECETQVISEKVLSSLWKDKIVAIVRDKLFRCENPCLRELIRDKEAQGYRTFEIIKVDRFPEYLATHQ